MDLVAVLAMLVAGFATAALTGVAGALRTDSAYRRLNASHQGADALVEDFIPWSCPGRADTRDMRSGRV